MIGRLFLSHLVYEVPALSAEEINQQPTVNLVDPELYSHGDPFEVWRWLRANDPVRWHPPAHLPGFWVLTRYADVRAVYRDPATFSSARGILLRPEEHGADPGGGRTLALTDPPRHRQLRALVDRWFAVRSVRTLQAEMADVARTVVEGAVERGRCDFVADVAARIPLFVICKVMGVPAARWEHMFALTNQAFGAADALDRRLAHLEILGYFEDLRIAKEKNPADDLVSALTSATIGGSRLTTDEIILNCDNLLVGGTENTRIAAAGGMLAFLEHPAEWDALSADPGLFPLAIEEVLRWTSSATHIMRTATRPVVLHGRRIEAGERVTLWNPSANRDEAAFENPELFDIRRQPNRHLAFGAGEHFCLGSTLARQELEILFRELRLRGIRIELDGAPVRLRSIVVNGLERLPVNLVQT
jgi:cytochrome P450